MLHLGHNVKPFPWSTTPCGLARPPPSSASPFQYTMPVLHAGPLPSLFPRAGTLFPKVTRMACSPTSFRFKGHVLREPFLIPLPCPTSSQQPPLPDHFVYFSSTCNSAQHAGQVPALQLASGGRWMDATQTRKLSKTMASFRDEKKTMTLVLHFAECQGLIRKSVTEMRQDGGWVSWTAWYSKDRLLRRE